MNYLHKTHFDIKIYNLDMNVQFMDPYFYPYYRRISMCNLDIYLFF